MIYFTKCKIHLSVVVSVLESMELEVVWYRCRFIKAWYVFY